MNLFDSFGIDFSTMATEKKESNTVKKPEKKEKTTKKEPEKKGIKLPITILTGYREPLTITPELNDNKDTISEEELKNKISQQYVEYQPAYTVIEAKDNKCFVGFDDDCLLSKGEVHLTENSRIYLGGEQLPVDNLLNGESSTVSCDDVFKELSSVNAAFATNCSLYTAKDNPIMALAVKYPLMTDSDIISYPIRVVLFGRDMFTISEEEYKQFNEVDEANEDAENEFSVDTLKGIIAEHYSEFSGRCCLRYSKEHNIVFPSLEVHSKTANASKKKEEEYPTNGTIVSFVFNRITLSPENFDGKESVSKKELIKYIGTIYPEYDNDRTQLRYEKKKNMIVPILVGSSKGAMTIITTKSDYEQEIRKSYSLFRFKNYRVESTPVSLTVADGRGEGYYEYRLEKMPSNLFESIRLFFIKIAAMYGTEVLVRVYYDPTDKKYVLEVPKQKVSASAIHTVEPLIEGLWPIMDIHSHCRYAAFFSPTDNADEVGNRIYGVMGRVLGDGEFLFRAGTGGKHISISKYKIFSDLIDDEDYLYILNRQLKNISFY